MGLSAASAAVYFTANDFKRLVSHEEASRTTGTMRHGIKYQVLLGFVTSNETAVVAGAVTMCSAHAEFLVLRRPGRSNRRIAGTILVLVQGIPVAVTSPKPAATAAAAGGRGLGLGPGPGLGLGLGLGAGVVVAGSAALSGWQ